jgi:hypothetical protein
MMRLHHSRRVPWIPYWSMEPKANLTPPGHLSRPKALAALREKLRGQTDADHCVCAVAERLGFSCHGFAQFSDEELRRRFSWIADRRPDASRGEIEALVNAFILGRQEVAGAALACDVETREQDLCGGWNGFDNSRLEEFYRTVFGQPVSIG